MPVSTPTVIYEKRDGAAYITLNRPDAMNALSRELSAGIREAVLDFQADPSMLVAIITGAGGRAFSAGMDLKERDADNAAGQIVSNPVGTSTYFTDLGVFKPLIAAIDGFCVAGGLELALQCDIRIASAKSEFGLPEARWSITPAYGLHNLARMIPLGEALNMMLTGRRIKADRAHQIGLIQDIAPDRESMLALVEEYAADVKLCAPLAVQAMKQVVHQGKSLPVEYSQKLGAPITARVRDTEDAKEGPRAFAEKRKPVWKMR